MGTQVPVKYHLGEKNWCEAFLKTGISKDTRKILGSFCAIWKKYVVFSFTIWLYITFSFSTPLNSFVLKWSCCCGRSSMCIATSIEILLSSDWRNKEPPYSGHFQNLSKLQHGVKLTADQVLIANRCWLLKIRNRAPEVISAALGIDS
jgi:hypothetical protein